MMMKGKNPIAKPSYHFHTHTHTQIDRLTHILTNEQEDQYNDRHHEPGVSIQSDGLDQPRLEELTPSSG